MLFWQFLFGDGASGVSLAMRFGDVFVSGCITRSHIGIWGWYVVT